MVLINFYRIVSSNTEKVYVGSTEHTIEERLRGHEYDYKHFQESKDNYKTSFDILELKEYSIHLIETLECETRKDRDTIECKHIINTPNTVNKYMPGRTRTQYRQDHKEQSQQYREDNKQQHQQNANQKQNCICGGKYTTANKSTHEKSKKHQHYIINQQPINNYGVINIYN